jgi:hypothetical protein
MQSWPTELRMVPGYKGVIDSGTWLLAPGRDAMRRARQILIRIAACAAGAALICLPACHGGGPVLVEATKIPGTYVMGGRGFTDELVLKADGTIIRTATNGARRWTRSGRWISSRIKTDRPEPNTVVEFTSLIPDCMVEAGRASTPFPWATAGTPLCERSKVAFFCFDHERLSICFDESTEYRFHRSGFFLPWLRD